VKAPSVTARATLLAGAWLVPAALLAQGPPTAFAGVQARTVSFSTTAGGIKSVSEIAVPIALLWPATPRLSFDLGGYYASATRKGSNDSSATISGLTDIQVRGVYQIVPDLAVLSVSANLPTGTSKLKDNQLLTAGAIASDLLPYPVANFGSGFNLTSGLALALPVGGWAIGVAGSYRLNGDFTPFADSGAGSYKAGGEFRVRLGADRVVGQGRVSLGVTYSSFGEDNFASSPIFQSGNRWIGQGSWSFPIGNMALQLYAWDLYRSAGSQLDSTGKSVASTQKRNVLAFGAAGAVQMGRNVLRPQLEYRIHTLGGSSLSNAGNLLSVGAQYQWAVGARFALVPSLRFDMGTQYVLDGVGNPTSQSDKLTGWNFGLMLRTTM